MSRTCWNSWKTWRLTDCSRSSLSRLCKFASLRTADQALLLYAFMLVAAIRAGLWVAPFRWIRERAEQAARDASLRRPSPPQSIPNLTGAVELVSRYIPGATCLTQALSAQFLVARAGHAATLRIGVLRATKSPLKAHAWLECHGRIVIGGDVPGMEGFKALPGM